MVAITATNSATPSAQVWQSRSRLQQARQEADQAETLAKQLQDQADQAEQQAQQGKTRVSVLTNQLARADTTYSTAISNQAASRQASTVQAVLAPTATAASNKFSFPDNPLKSGAGVWSAANQAPSSGRFVNKTA
jgi:small-conductance mechanosensitive channel